MQRRQPGRAFATSFLTNVARGRNMTMVVIHNLTILLRIDTKIAILLSVVAASEPYYHDWQVDQAAAMRHLLTGHR